MWSGGRNEDGEGPAMHRRCLDPAMGQSIGQLRCSSAVLPRLPPSYTPPEYTLCPLLSTLVLQDLLIPAMKPPEHFKSSPLLGAAPLERDVLLYFRGDVGVHREAHYSRGIRQKYFRQAVVCSLTACLVFYAAFKCRMAYLYFRSDRPVVLVALMCTCAH